MFNFWFLLVSIFAATYIFNVGVATNPTTKKVVNVLAILLIIVLAIAATVKISI